MLRVEGLWFAYPRREPTLRDISLHARAGESLCLLGPNGTGKTTLLRCILGVSPPMRGSVRLAGKDLRRLAARDRGHLVAYVPQAGETPFAFQVRDLVLMGRIPYLGCGRSPTREDHRAVESALEERGIRPLADRRFNELSGGERQLTLLARALAQDARVLVLDEPTANLDYGNQIKVLRAVRSLSGRGYTVVMSSHFPNHAFLASSRVLLLRDGTLLADGPPEEVVTGERLTDLYQASVRVVAASERGQEDKEIRVCVPVLG